MTCPKRLTVKLRGRTTTSDRQRGPAISTGSRGAKQTRPHGPLQRLLGGVVLGRETRKRLLKKCNPAPLPQQRSVHSRAQYRNEHQCLVPRDRQMRKRE